MSENPLAPTPAPTPAATPPGPVAAAPAQLGVGTSIGNPRDIQGILALVVVGGTFGIAAVAIALGTAAATVLSAVLPLAGTIIGFYYGQKSQQ